MNAILPLPQFERFQVTHALLLLAAATTLSLARTSCAAIVEIEYVTVGNPGNLSDPSTGGLYGAVAYQYEISKYETTIDQYTAFLNAVASTDTYSLYSPFMQSHVINGIQQHGSSGSHTYTVAMGSGNKPIAYVSWFDAARFANWLHNGQPSGNQDASTTEDGAYTLNGAWSGVSVTKNVGATVWIPSESEWYKAAYYDPTKNNGSGGYWMHANQSDGMTSNDIGTPGAANHYDVNGAAVYTGANWGITDVGAYGENSESFYGTSDQGGNLAEWTDGVRGTTQRIQRGGSWANSNGDLLSAMRGGQPAYYSDETFGFRLASIPEPSSLLFALSSIVIFQRRRITNHPARKTKKLPGISS